jgi:hypothetical protein
VRRWERMASANIVIKVDLDVTAFNEKMDQMMEQIAFLRKVSFWFVLKMRLLGVHKRRTMISIQELIDKDHQYRL